MASTSCFNLVFEGYGLVHSHRGHLGDEPIVIERDVTWKVEGLHKRTREKPGPWCLQSASSLGLWSEGRTWVPKRTSVVHKLGKAGAGCAVGRRTGK